MKLSWVFVAVVGLLPLLAACQSHPKSTEKPPKVIKHCLKPAEPTDGKLRVIQWKWNGARVGYHDVSYFTFRYTPESDDPGTYESIRAVICEKFVTSYTPLDMNSQFAGRKEPITEILVNTQKIVHVDVAASAPLSKDISPCTCPKK